MKKHAPATLRNREAICAILQQELPDSGTVLEVASGSGEHAVFFAAAFPALIWQPSDPDPEACASIAAYAQEAALANLQSPLALDASLPDWPVEEASAIVCINMIHISPREATQGLFAGAQRCLGSGSPLILYGPFLEAGVATALSNLDFDASLKARNSAWGIRNVDWIDELAESHGLARMARYAMPANNLTLVYRPI